MPLSWVKFQDFAEQRNKGVHNFAAHAIKLALTNLAPLATNTVLADITQIAAGNGYTAGGAAVPNVTIVESAGTATIAGNAVTFTSSGAGMAAFRYLVLYNDTATAPADALIAFADYGSSVSLAVGETFTASLNAVATSGTLFTDS